MPRPFKALKFGIERPVRGMPVREVIVGPTRAVSPCTAALSPVTVNPALALAIEAAIANWVRGVKNGVTAAWTAANSEATAAMACGVRFVAVTLKLA